MRIQSKRLVLCQHADCIYTGINAIAQWKINDTVLASKRNCRFGNFGSQYPKSAALATGQKHSDHLFFNHGITS